LCNESSHKSIGAIHSVAPARFFPIFPSDFDWVYSRHLPPGYLIACPVNGTVVDPAERDRKFVARFAAERTWLHKFEVMRIRWFADKSNVFSVAVATGLAEREGALVDYVGLMTSNRLIIRANFSTTSICLCGLSVLIRNETNQLCLERVFQLSRVRCRQAVFAR
jgi:hypothetical protein